MPVRQKCVKKNPLETSFSSFGGDSSGSALPLCRRLHLRPLGGALGLRDRRRIEQPFTGGVV